LHIPIDDDPILWKRAASLIDILLEGISSSSGKLVVPSGSNSPAV